MLLFDFTLENILPEPWWILLHIGHLDEIWNRLPDHMHLFKSL